MCDSIAEGGRRCPNHAQLLNLTAKDLAPAHRSDIPDVAWANTALDIETLYREYKPANVAAAVELLQTIAEHEPKATSDLIAAADATNGRAAGLEFRLKSPESLARKIRDKTRGEDAPRHELTSLISDAQRYTVGVRSQDDVVNAAHATVRALTERGWSIAAAEHSYVADNPYKGLHLTMITADGITTEVQIHSEAGLELKDINHVDYEIARDENQPIRARLEAKQRMRLRYADLPDPAEISDLRTLGGQPVKTKTYR